MCWFVTLASKMTGKEIPGVGMAPGGKIVKPEEEVKQHSVHTCPFNASVGGLRALVQDAGHR